MPGPDTRESLRNGRPASAKFSVPKKSASESVRQTTQATPRRTAAVSQEAAKLKLPSAIQSHATASSANTSASGTNWLNRIVQGYVGNAGDYAGNLIRGVGNGVNKVGENIGGSITNTTRGWGESVAGYGNDIKDAVGVGGPRVATAGNPLGLAGAGSGKVARSKTSNKISSGRSSASNPLGL